MKEVEYCDLPRGMVKQYKKQQAEEARERGEPPPWELNKCELCGDVHFPGGFCDREGLIKEISSLKKDKIVLKACFDAELEIIKQQLAEAREIISEIIGDEYVSEGSYEHARAALAKYREIMGEK